jgi:hypothetical protein
LGGILFFVESEKETIQWQWRPHACLQLVHLLRSLPSPTRVDHRACQPLTNRSVACSSRV